MSQEKIKEYSNGEITIVWKPNKCIHAAKCVKALPEVYHPKDHPWIQPQNASTQALIQQIATCPSGALSYYKAGEDLSQARQTIDEEHPKETEQVRVEVMEGGPLMIYGTVNIKNKDGKEEIQENTCALCRCGASNNKPYCDGSHQKVEFDKE